MTGDRSGRPRWTCAGALLATVVLVGGCAAARAHAGKAPSSSPRTTHASATNAARPLPGPTVVDAQLFAGGRGYVRTDDALLWTDNGGKTWRSITPPGVSAARLQAASVVVQADGSAWVALALSASDTALTLLRRDPTTGAWRSTRVPLGAMAKLAPGGERSASLSFAGPADGWLMVDAQWTANSGISEMFRTTDGGEAWTLENRPEPRPGSIGFLTSRVGFLSAIPSQALWITRDAGRSWTPLRLATPARKRADIATLRAPTLAGNAIVIAAAYATPVQGNPVGLVLYRSTDLGRTWTEEQPSGMPTAEQYDFAITPDGTRAVLLGAQHSTDFAIYTWATSVSSDGGAHFSTTTSRHSFYPDSASIAGADTIWAIAGANGCTGFKTGCWQQSGLVASTDGGTTWHQIAVPS